MLTGKRKLVAFVVGTLANSALAYFGKIDPGVYSVVAVSLCTGFFVGNVVSNKLGNPAA